jgi:ABC-type dipeptide/oligopeptide/nickel transport system ATPase component
MSKLIIIRGNSGSGKTTVAKALQQKLGRNTMLISQDVIRRDMLHVKDGVDTKALPLMKELLLYGRNNCDYVILEGILNASWYQSLFKLATQEFKEELFAYYYDIPFEETVIRHQTKPNSGEFSENDMKRWWTEKDFINFISEKVITKDMELEDAIEHIYQEVIKVVM